MAVTTWPNVFALKSLLTSFFFTQRACVLPIPCALPAARAARKARLGAEVDCSSSSDSKCFLAATLETPLVPTNLLAQLWARPRVLCRYSEHFPEALVLSIRDQLHFGVLLARLHLKKTMFSFVFTALAACPVLRVPTPIFS